MNKIKFFILSIVLFLPGLLSAQETRSFYEQFQLEIVLGVAALVCIVALLALVVAWWGLRVIVRQRLQEQGIEEPSVIKAQPGEEELGFWAKFWNRFNSAVPVAKEETVITDHEYDGIRELDNRLPPWWLYGFYFTIAFSVVYLLHYHVFDTGMSQQEEYEAAMADHEEQVQAYMASMEEEGGVDMNTIELLTDDEALAAGQQLFEVNCAQCHAKDGGGMTALGPNLTDKYWKNGGDFESVYNTIKDGVPTTSMIPWESQLGPMKLRQVASYVYSLEGTTPADPKEPEGELYEREETQQEEEAASDTTSVAMNE